jgi:DNA-binding MarR family transcriptional regulator
MLPANDPAGSLAFDGLDRALHEKARLGILTGLLAHDAGLTFSELKELCGLTDGNLNRHLATLVEAELIVLIKESGSKRPHTRIRLTTAGRKRFLDYLELLEGIVSNALAVASPHRPTTSPA